MGCWKDERTNAFKDVLQLLNFSGGHGGCEIGKLVKHVIDDWLDRYSNRGEEVELREVLRTEKKAHTYWSSVMAWGINR